MSMFNKRRKKLRQIQEKDRKQKEENAKKFDKSMQDYLETIKILKRDYPEYNRMSNENALKLFNEVFNKVRHDTKH